MELIYDLGSSAGIEIPMSEITTLEIIKYEKDNNHNTK